MTAGESPYYSSADAPCGARAFLAAARAGAFPSFGSRRKILARRGDVEAWIESRPRPVRVPAIDGDGDGELLARAGVIVPLRRAVAR